MNLENGFVYGNAEAKALLVFLKPTVLSSPCETLEAYSLPGESSRRPASGIQDPSRNSSIPLDVPYNHWPLVYKVVVMPINLELYD